MVYPDSAVATHASSRRGGGFEGGGRPGTFQAARPNEPARGARCGGTAMTVRHAACALILASGLGALASLYGTATAQLIDRTLAPNLANEGIAKSLVEEIGAGR